jgi:hypothetical protein
MNDADAFTGVAICDRLAKGARVGKWEWLAIR